MWKKTKSNSLKYIVYIGHFATIMIVPILLCVYIAIYLQKRFGLGTWIVGIGIALGLLLMISNFVGFVRQVLSETDKEHRRK